MLLPPSVHNTWQEPWIIGVLAFEAAILLAAVALRNSAGATGTIFAFAGELNGCSV